MAYLGVAAVLVGTIAGLNLLLTLGVVRRLREHTERLTELTGSGPAPGSTPELMRPAGERPDQFQAVTVDGVELTRSSLVTPALVGFFAPGCAPCREWIPRFVKAAGELPQGRAQALAVVAGHSADAQDELAELGGAAQVVLERPDGPVARAFAVTGWPALCRLDADGTIATTDSYAAIATPVAT